MSSERLGTLAQGTKDSTETRPAPVCIAPFTGTLEWSLSDWARHIPSLSLGNPTCKMRVKITTSWGVTITAPLPVIPPLLHI